MPELDMSGIVLVPKSAKYNRGLELGNRTFREEFDARKDVLSDYTRAMG